jgi:hypothetical protein
LLEQATGLLTSLTLGTWCVPQVVFWLPLGFNFGGRFAKIGSSELKKSLQNGLFKDFVARKGGIFRGGAEHRPRGFLGGDLELPMSFSTWIFVCGGVQRRSLRDKIDLHTNHQNRSFLLAQTATSYRLDLFWFVCNEVAF